MQLKNKTILIVSNEPWGNMWYSKHNWAFELSKNNLVYFINPPNRWKFKDIFKTTIKIKDYSKTLKILNYNNRLPLTKYNFLFKINESLIFKALNKFFKNKKKLIFWSFDPYRLIYPNKLNFLHSIYFVADRYLIPREKILIRNVNSIISVSKDLTKDINHHHILNLSHGISDSEFNTDKDVVGYENFILYIGGIDYRLDYLLIANLLKSFPNEKFLFIGKISNIDDNDFRDIFIDRKFLNFEYKMAIHFKELKNYIAKAKICLAPMKKGIQGNSINHHKLLQYLAHGKPVLSAKFIDYQDNNLLIEYSDTKDAILKFKNILEEADDIALINKRINFAKEFLYPNLIKKIEEFLS